MGSGLSRLVRWLIIAGLLFLVACMPPRMQIAETQSRIVTLTIQCDKGSLVACEELEVEKAKLQELLR